MNLSATWIVCVVTNLVPILQKLSLLPVSYLIAQVPLAHTVFEDPGAFDIQPYIASCEEKESDERDANSNSDIAEIRKRFGILRIGFDTRRRL